MYTTTTTTLFSLVELIESRARLQSAAHRLQVFYRPNGKISIKYRWNERVGGEGWKYGEETSRRDFQAFISLSLSLSLSLFSLFRQYDTIPVSWCIPVFAWQWHRSAERIAKICRAKLRFLEVRSLALSLVRSLVPLPIIRNYRSALRFRCLILPNDFLRTTSDEQFYLDASNFVSILNYRSEALESHKYKILSTVKNW